MTNPAYRRSAATSLAFEESWSIDAASKNARHVGNVDRGGARGQILIGRYKVRRITQRARMCVTSAGTAACLLALFLLICVPAWAAQPAAPAATPVAVQPEAAPDSLGRNTPRGTVLGFLIAARTGQEDVAVQYLDTRLRGKAATELARRLFTVLDLFL